MTMSLYDIYDWASLLAGTSSACLGHSRSFLGYIIHAQSWETCCDIFTRHRLTSLLDLLDFEDNYKMTMPYKSAFGYDPGFARKTPRYEVFFVSSRFTSKIWAPFLRRWHERCYLRSFADLFVRFRKQVQCTTGLVERVFQTLLHSTIAHCDLHGRKIRPMVPSTLFRVILVNRDVASPRGL